MNELNIQLAQRAQGISASPTMAIDAQAKTMQKQGIEVINFGLGETDFDTPEHIKQAAIRALEKGETKYTAVAGIETLKQAIADKLKTDNGLDYGLNQIVVSAGAKHSLYNTIQVLIDPGDEVILPAPYWVSYAEMVKLAGGIPRIIPTLEENAFKLTPDALQAAINPNSKLLILNSPSNPTGSMYTGQELEALGQIIVQNQLLVISDEIYEKLVYSTDKHISIASLSSELKALTIVINGVSKSYSMTGWRIGYAAAPQRIAKAMSDLQSHATSNPTSFAQWGALEALKGPQTQVQVMAGEFKQRRDYVCQRLQAIPGVRCQVPSGAFYVFPNIAESFGKTYGDQVIQNSTDLSQLLLTKAHIAMVPGIAFGADAYLRVSYANSLQNIERGLNRFADFWNNLK